MELERKAIEDQIKSLKKLYKSLDNIDGGLSIVWQNGMNINSWGYQDPITKDVIIVMAKSEILRKIHLREKELKEL